MKKLIALLLLATILISSLGATSLDYTYTPYEEGEFPNWSLDLRRAETIFFGSYVITMPLAAGSLALMNNLDMLDLNSRQQVLASIGFATGLSLFISGLDWILGRI